ncbi:MAG: IS66 family insertion sequence element accessory protein TnpB [Mangrovibacterium sp.]
MFALTSENKFHLYSESTDMRKGFESLSGIVRNVLGANPLNGEVFIFINKPRNKIKLLHWQDFGFVLYYKPLERGTFELPINDSKSDSISLSYVQLAMIIDGISIKNLVRRKRYSHMQSQFTKS